MKAIVAAVAVILIVTIGLLIAVEVGAPLGGLTHGQAT
jgi:hypothetical protein